MKNYTHITLHCSATQNDPKFDKDWLYHEHVVCKGWSDIGYHFMIDADGRIHDCRPLSRKGAHVRGYNDNNIGVCMIGGVDAQGKAVDNFTLYQKEVAKHFVMDLQAEHNIPLENVKGHRDYSPDLNGDGKITRNEFIKMCPCFDVQEMMNDDLI